MTPSSIKELMTDSCVLLTGVTGFVGGSLLERILCLTPGPEKIFVLVRKKQGVDPQDRLKTILSSPLFSGVHPDKLQRVQVIPGDITQDGLGLSSSDSNLLISKCTHVFHVAAFISFAAQLDLAIRINLLGSRQVLHLAKRMINIQAMVYVSTAYANCTKENTVLEEKLYPTAIDPVKFIEMVKNLSSVEIQKMSAELMGNHPNTYTLTKQMAENLLIAEKEHVPLSIVRPSIVLNTWKTPFPGWVDNVHNGACAFIAGVTKGLFRTFQANPDAIQDVIPADMVVSTILASALHAAVHPRDLNIFHCTSSAVNSTTWGRYCERVVTACRNHPCEDAVWYPAARPRTNHLRNVIVLYMFQILPAIILDFVMQRFGRKTPLLEIQYRYFKGTKYTSYFTNSQWYFGRDNASALLNILPADELEEHPMDPKAIEWDSYFENCVIGMRRYFFKDSEMTTKKALRQMKRLKIISAVTPFLSFLLFWGLISLMGLSSITAACFGGALVLFLIWL
ncbi:putative fatty acyl-CoA reductase CG5065 [Cephus cinctus]|uniref:Fatty acyl-CoA reductase n=1 Tax=Cephus cinctus TaxID=211228 RepID=A0AAJ7C5W7_CEPCN|nr:putative fatty acyl-CoA reductase CG5065 [Cephus cinctus]